jgi:hypothetical protein
VWPVFAAWLMAFVAIVIFSAIAAALLASAYPDVAPAVLLRELPVCWRAPHVTKD